MILRILVARDGVERFGTPCFQQLADSTKDTKDTEDTKASFCVRFVCGFFWLCSAEFCGRGLGCFV
jgi:hypothetical protein